MEQIKLSPYRVAWIEFRAIKGIVTKHDEKVINKISSRGKSTKCLYKHFPDKKSAEKFLRELDCSKLNKSYECRILSDKQFGMWSLENGYLANFTNMQNNKVVII